MKRIHVRFLEAGDVVIVKTMNRRLVLKVDRTTKSQITVLVPHIRDGELRVARFNRGNGRNRSNPLMWLELPTDKDTPRPLEAA